MCENIFAFEIYVETQNCFCGIVPFLNLILPLSYSCNLSKKKKKNPDNVIGSWILGSGPETHGNQQNDSQPASEWVSK